MDSDTDTDTGTDSVTVWLVPTEQPPEVADRLEHVLDDEERRRAARIPDPTRRRGYVVAHGALREILAAYAGLEPARIRWLRGPNGKPYPAADRAPAARFATAPATAPDTELWAHLSIADRAPADCSAAAPDAGLSADHSTADRSPADNSAPAPAPATSPETGSCVSFSTADQAPAGRCAAAPESGLSANLSTADRSPADRSAPATSSETELCVNLSTADEAALVAVARGREVGVDLEPLPSDRAAVRLAARFFPAGQADYVAGAADPIGVAERFVTLWTRKEACVKARGGRLSQGMLLEVHGATPICVLVPGEVGSVVVRVQDLPAPPGHRAAVALTGSAPFDVRHRVWRPDARPQPESEA